MLRSSNSFTEATYQKYLLTRRDKPEQQSVRLTEEQQGQVMAMCPDRLRYFALRDTVAVQSKFHFGYTLLVDISGFTSMSVRAFAGGAEGLDAFRRGVSGVFEDLIATVTDAGGDVVTFAGDALICFFPASSVTDVLLAIRAVECAIALCSLKFNDICIHVALTCGDVCFATLGGFEDKWSLVMSGACMAELSDCIDEAGRFETVVSHRVSAMTNPTFIETFNLSYLLSGNVRIDGINTQTTVPSAQSPRDYFLAAMKFIPVPVMCAIHGDTLHSLAEVRRVTTLFLKLDSFDFHLHRDLVSLQDVYVAMQEVVVEYGGFIRQFVIDDKGCVMIVLWGVTTASYPNNCCRAVYCGEALSMRLRKISHSCSIGITTGKAYCGMVGSVRRQDYVAMGKMVNLAARLMGKATGRMLIGQDTYESLPLDVANHFAVVNIGSLKGFSNNWCVYSFDEVGFKASLALTDARRDDAIYATNEVRVALERACDVLRGLANQSDMVPQNTHVVVLKGAPGTGKSIMVQKYCRDAKKSGVIVIIARLCRRHEMEGYAVIRKILGELIQLDRNINHAMQFLILDRLKECFPHDDQGRLSERLRALTELFQSSASSRQLTKQQRPTIARLSSRVAPTNSVLSESIVQLIIFLMRRNNCYSIVLDGAEFIAEASWPTIRRLIDADYPMVLFLSVTRVHRLARQQKKDDTIAESSWNTARMSKTIAMNLSTTRASSTENVEDSRLSPLHTHIARMAQNTHCITITLSSLTFQDICDYMQQEFSFAPVALHVVQHVYALSCGNPFWVFLLIEFIRDCGSSEFEKLVELQLADELLATCLLSKYSTQQCMLIKVASVFGDDFDVSMLVSILAPTLRRSEIIRILTVFVHGGLLHRVNDTQYQFHNSLIRNALYNMLPTSDAHEIHYKIAKAIEASSSTVSWSAGMLAHHYSCCAADVKHNAFRHAIHAARECFHESHIDLALCCAMLALRVSKTPSDLQQLIRLLCELEELIEAENAYFQSISGQIIALKEKISQQLIASHDKGQQSRISWLLCCLRKI